MGRAAPERVIDHTDPTLLQKRQKALRASGGYTGNLAAFNQARSLITDTADISRAVSLKPHLRPRRAATPQPQIVPHQFQGTADQLPRNPLPDPLAQSQPQQPAQQQPAAKNDSVNAASLPFTITAPRKKLAAAILLSLGAGAIVGSIWTGRFTQPEQPIVTADPATSETILPPVASVEPVDLPQVTLPLVPVNEDYLEEIRWLQSQNTDLEQQVETLNMETLELTQELLRLDLEIAALRSLGEPVIETRTVYNFVNVPIGESVEFSESSAPVVEAEYEQYVPVPEDSETNYNLEDQFAYDPETGYYLDPSFVDQQYTEEQFIEEQYLLEQQYLDQDYVDDPYTDNGDDYLDDGNDSEINYPPVPTDTVN